MATDKKKQSKQTKQQKQQQQQPSKKEKAKPKKKKKTGVNKGIVHVHSTTNNTIVTITDEKGNAISWASAGTAGYKGSKKSTPYAAGLAATKAAEAAKLAGIKSVKISVNGTGQGKETAIRNIAVAGIEITEIQENTPIPHNGCKPPKKPR